MYTSIVTYSNYCRRCGPVSALLLRRPSPNRCNETPRPLHDIGYTVPKEQEDVGYFFTHHPLALNEFLPLVLTTTATTTTIATMSWTGVDMPLMNANHDVHDDDDDELDNLFSFATASSTGAESSSAASMTTATTTTTVGASGPNDPNHHRTDAGLLSPAAFLASMTSAVDGKDQDEDSANGSEDSFLQLLEQQQQPTDLMTVSTNTVTVPPTPKDELSEETELQDLLDWLDQDDDAAEEAAQKERDEEEVLLPPTPPVVVNVEEKKEETEISTTMPEEQLKFQSLEEVVKSSKSSMSQVREWLDKESFQVSSALRPYLWSRVVCGKTLDELLSSSVADSFETWEQHHQYLFLPQPPPQQLQPQNETDNTAITVGDDKILPSTQGPPQLSRRQRAKLHWILQQANEWSDRIVTVRKGEKVHCQKALASLLLNHYFTGRTEDDDDNDNNSDDDNNKEEHDEEFDHDTLLPPVACAILSAGVPKTAASVMLSQIVPHFMPILALNQLEREDAAQLMHQQFYLLAAYHLPSLVLHLDRYLPNWFLWPDFKGHSPKNGQGYIPQSYLLSHMAGESGTTSRSSTLIHPQWILALWDLMLTSSNNSLRFFLVLAVLEATAHEIVLLTDDDLKAKLVQVLSFQHQEEEERNGDFSIQDTQDQITNQDAQAWVQKWTSKAQLLWERTPISISRRLKRVEDTAVTKALTKRQEEAEKRMKLKLEREARAHQEAQEMERERKADEARLRLTRARLVAFYLQNNPGKETNIDKIMEAYKDRYDVLDAKLKQKYGVGFNPALKPKSAQPVLSSTSKSATSTTKKEDNSEDDLKRRKRGQLVAKVSPGEVVPAICWSKKANEVRMTKLELGNRLEEKVDALVPLRFYLVDSRPAETVLNQGRFPTSVSFPPEDLTDADRLKEQEVTFEALRGAVHIVIMGEGFAALPALYGHKLTQNISDCIAEDDARNNNCALFFMKKGFPFVSILDGGFAGAHSFLAREGHKHHLHVNDVLADYDPDVSIFGQFERVNNSTGREKAQRALQNIFDSSLVALTKNSRRLETLSSELGQTEQPKKGGNMVTRFLGGGGGNGGKSDQASASGTHNRNENKPGPAVFRNPFARKNDPNAAPKEGGTALPLIVESVENLDPDATEMAMAASESLTPSQPAAVAPQPIAQSEQQQQQQQVSQVPLATAPEPPKHNPFAGFGAAFKQAAAKAAVNTAGSKVPIVISNPFARFNPGGRNLDRSKHGQG